MVEGKLFCAGAGDHVQGGFGHISVWVSRIFTGAVEDALHGGDVDDERRILL